MFRLLGSLLFLLVIVGTYFAVNGTATPTDASTQSTPAHAAPEADDPYGKLKTN